MTKIVPMTCEQPKQDNHKCKCIHKSCIIRSCIYTNIILIGVIVGLTIIAIACFFVFLIISLLFQYEYEYEISDKCVWTNITVVDGQCVNKKIIPFENMKIRYVFAHIIHTSGKQFVCTKEEFRLGCTNTEFKTPSSDTKCGFQFEVNERTIGDSDDCYFPDQYGGLVESTSKIKFGTKTTYTQLGDIIMNGWYWVVFVCMFILMILVSCLLVLFSIKKKLIS